MIGIAVLCVCATDSYLAEEEVWGVEKSGKRQAVQERTQNNVFEKYLSSLDQ